MAMRIWIAALSMALMLPGAASAALVTYSNEGTFLTATGATAEPATPNLGKISGGTATLGSLEFSLAGATELFFGTAGVKSGFTDWSTKLPGHDIAFSGEESSEIKVLSASPLRAFGFQIHEPTVNNGIAPDSCNAPCFDTTFDVKLFQGATEVGSASFNPADDVKTFFGVTNPVAFDRVNIIDSTGTIDNEFFGRFYTREVPEPATLGLIGAGLAGLGFVARRRKAA